MFKAFATSSTVGLALRSTARAVPLVVLATAVLLGIGVNAVYRALRATARPVLASLSVIAVGALIVANFPALVDGTYYGENLQRPEAIPQYWDDAAAALDARRPRHSCARAARLRLRVVPLGEHGRSDHARD